jgi:hypothetical protein
VAKPSRGDVEHALYSADREVKHCGTKWLGNFEAGSREHLSADAVIAFCLALPDQWLAYMRRTLNDALAVSDGVNFTDEQSQHAGAAVRLGHGRVPVYELFAIGGASGRRWVAPALST